jgi:ribosomal-protein-alanine N-acetyltransferase
MSSVGRNAHDDWRREVPRLAGRLVTAREVIRPDAATLFEQLTDARVTPHIAAPPPTLAAFEGFIEWAKRERTLGRGVCFGIVPRGLQRAVGLIQIRAAEPSFFVAEWGFALGAAFWSTGVFPEAAGLVAQFAFEAVGVHRLEARVVAANGRGNGALQKLGAGPEAILSRAFKRKTDYDEQLLWSLIADEWEPRVPERRERFLEASAKAAINRAIADVTENLRESRRERSPGSPPLYPFFVSDNLPK